MSAKSRRKGRVWNNAVVNWLRDNGFPSAERTEYLDAQTGDILGIPGWSLECKNGQRTELAAWVDQSTEQAETAGVPYHAVIHKRKGVGDVGKAYVTMPLDVFANWLLE